MVKSAPKIKPHGSPSKNNIRRTSNPKTPQEQIHAIGDDLEAAIKGYIPVLIMEGALDRRNLRQVLGSGGPELELFKEEFEKIYPNAAVKGEESKEKRDKNSAPVLDKVSRDSTVNYNLPKDTNSNPPNKTTTKKGKK